MIHRIEIWTKDGFSDPHADGVATHIHELGTGSVTGVISARLFFVEGDLTADAVEKIASELLVDPVMERYNIDSTSDEGKAVVEVHLQAGVMDPVAKSTEDGIAELGIPGTTVRTARRYELAGNVTAEETQTIAARLLANPVIEDMFFAAHNPQSVVTHKYELEIGVVELRDLSDDGLLELSKNGDLFLNLTEMKAIQDHYKAAGRNPRDVELEMIAQTWSEHCNHKTFRSDVCLKDADGNVVVEIPNLLKNTVFKATMDLDKPWCLNVFEDNAGVIEFDEDNAVCFKVETHNHPSAIEPYGGSMTGIGGVVRDPMGTGLGSKPFANTDVFCFGPTDLALADTPKGVLHPRRVMRGVVSGVRDYGNRMGIPTVNGALYFDEKYLGNPLVFCGTAAMMPNEYAKKRTPNHGDIILCVGGRTGRDGIHGATFSSGELTHEHETEFSHAVQIGNAITEKKVLDCLLVARDKGLYSCITDCGAGGLSSAVGEMGERIGADVQIDKIPLKYDGLSYSETWISEAQERMVLAVPPKDLDEILELFASEAVEATPIGTYGTEDRQLLLSYGGTQVGVLDMAFLHDGCPRPTKEAVWDFTPKPTPAVDLPANGNDVLADLLASPNIASKEWVIRQYDHEVQGGSVIKPLVGVTMDGPGDGAVTRPVLSSNKGVALTCGMNPQLGDLDPYQSALHAIDEALRNLIAVGGNIHQTAILDNFCWGNCNKPDRMGALVLSAQACYEAAMAYGTPFVSGKDSLNNEFQTDDGQTIAIPPTLLISAISVLDDATKCVTADAKTAGNAIYMVGLTLPEMGGAHVLKVTGAQTGNDVPKVDCKANLALFTALQSAIEAMLVRACHDLSEGGLAVAAAEMAFSGGLGVCIDPAALPVEGDVSEIARVYGESAGRFLVEVTPKNSAAFGAAMAGQPIAKIGEVTNDGQVKIGSTIDADIATLKAAWQGTFDW